MTDRRDIRPYDPGFVEELVEEGMDPSVAARVAATEMEGAAVNLHGYVEATQTLCNELDYDENAPRSREAEEAGKLYLAEVEQWATQYGMTAEEFLSLSSDEIGDRIGRLI